MPKTKGLITAVILDGKGGGKEVNWAAVNEWTPDQGLLWVHLNYKSPSSVKWIKQKSGLDKITANALIMEGSRPRTIINSKGISVFLRGVNLNPGENPEDMVSVRLWFNENRIISTRQHKLLSIDDVRKNITENNGPKTTEEFLVRLNNRLVDRMTDVLDAIEDRIDDLEESVVTTESYLLRPKLAEIRRQSIMIRRYLAPQREALSRLYSNDSTAFLTPGGRAHIREATDRIIRHIESLDSARDRATITQEELSSRLSERMDKHMYILSVAGVIFLPLTFITGLLGINVGGIPGAHHKLGFTIVCVILVALFSILLWIFYRKKWV